MKIRFHTPLLRCLLLIGLSAFAGAALRAGEDGTTTSVKLSAPDKPATLKIDIIWAKIDLTGTDGDTVTVTSVTGDNDGQQSRGDGLRRLDDEVSFDLVERDNVVSLKITGGNTPVLKITVPRAIALDFKAQAAELRVQNLTGDIEIHNGNGRVLLEDISGAAVVNSGLSTVHAVYATAPTKLIAITSMDGEVDLRVPAKTQANVRLHTGGASILTDFDKKSLKTKKETGGKVISGQLNGGGVDISINTMNGKITLRKTKSGTTNAATNSGTKDNVTVTFEDPDNFTDAAEDFPGETSSYYLNELRDCVQKEAALRLPAGSKLTVTFTDIDLAGMIRPERNNVRFMTSTTIPRAQLRFQLIGADGQVLQEGERKLSDMNYQMSIGLIGRSEPLYYDKELLKDWIAKEFKPRS